MFWVLHVIVVLVFSPGLFITIPAHLIAGAIKEGQGQ
jgi:hypothetical protein